MCESPIQFTQFTGEGDSRLTKAFSRNSAGKIVKDSAPLFARGIAERTEIAKLSDIEGVVEAMPSNQCIATGIFDSLQCGVVPVEQLDAKQRKMGRCARTKDFMSQPHFGLVLLDHDANPWLPVNLRCDTPGALVERLAAAIPAFASLGYSGTSSCSSGIYVEATNERYPGGGGLHVYRKRPQTGTCFPAHA